MLIKGFKFGMLLQFAIGPVCIFIFQMATLNGFYIAETGVIGVVLIDGLFILLSILGVAILLEKENIKSGLKIFGAVTLFVFGLSMITSIFGINIIPSLAIQSSSDIKSSFSHSLILTASNPLTILFWSGVFSSKIVEENMIRKDIYLFGIGALMATFISLTIVALSGNLIKPLFSSLAMTILNFAVGMLLIFFSLKMIWKSERKRQ